MTEVFPCCGGVFLLAAMFVGTIWAVQFLKAPGNHPAVWKCPEEQQPVDPMLLGYASRFYLPVGLVVLIIIAMWALGGG